MEGKVKNANIIKKNNAEKIILENFSIRILYRIFDIYCIIKNRFRLLAYTTLNTTLYSTVINPYNYSIFKHILQVVRQIYCKSFRDWILNINIIYIMNINK